MNPLFMSFVRVLVVILELLMLNRLSYGIWMKTANRLDGYDTFTLVLPLLMVGVFVAYVLLRKKEDQIKITKKNTKF